MNSHHTNRKKHIVWTIDPKATIIRITLNSLVLVRVFLYLNIWRITYPLILKVLTIARVYSELNTAKFKIYLRKVLKICTNLKLKKEWFQKSRYRFWCQTGEQSTQIINHNGLTNNLLFKIKLTQPSKEVKIVNLLECLNRKVIGKIQNYIKLFKDQTQMILRLLGKILHDLNWLIYQRHNLQIRKSQLTFKSLLANQ